MNGDVLAVGSEILPELNKILHKYTFSPCCIFIIAALLSFLICLIETAITISLHILGRLALKAVDEPFISFHR